MTTRKYVYLQGQDVVAVLSFEDTDEYQAGIISAIDSGAQWIEVDAENPADQFWTWDGIEAQSPAGDTWRSNDG